MLVLGLDPGLAITGYGLVAGEGNELKPIAYGVLRTPASLPLPDRLSRLYHDLQALLAQYRPESSAVEELFFSSNARTAIMVGEARGVALLALAEAQLPIGEYTPMQVKQSVTGYGGADKRQVQEMVRILLNLDDIPRPDDAADALAVAVCHLHSHRLDSLLGAD